MQAARRHTLPQQVSEFLSRGARPLLGVPAPRTRKHQ